MCLPSKADLNAKLTIWALFLQQFNMKVVYCQGVINQNAKWTHKTGVGNTTYKGGGGYFSTGRYQGVLPPDSGWRPPENL